MTVTACLPTIPPRGDMLANALSSVLTQTCPVAAISIAVDVDREGSWITRTRAVVAASTEWVALLDDDDWWYPNHLQVLTDCAAETGADYVYSYFDVIGGTDPLGTFGVPWEPGVQTTTTVLVRTELAQKVGWHIPKPDQMVGRNMAGEDYQFTIACHEAGAKIVHVPQVTWAWAHWGGNTSGMPGRW